MPKLPKYRSVIDFGRNLIETNDLDPVYVLLHHANIPEQVRNNWLLAYWLFYHCGVASLLAESRNFNLTLRNSVEGTKHPRGSERRHFRGKQAERAVDDLYVDMKDGNAVMRGLRGLTIGQTPDFPQVSKHIQKLRGFGTWIGFKVADMVERLDIIPVVFKPEHVFDMFDTPVKGAELVTTTYGPYTPERDDRIHWAYDYIIEHLGHYRAPPRHERPINIQEVETILCKWKSHRNGHYPIGNDLRELQHALELYTDRSDLAVHLLDVGEEQELW